MLKYRILDGNSVYCCIEHNDKILNRYFNILDVIFLKIKKMQITNKDINSYLKSPICISGLRESVKNLQN